MSDAVLSTAITALEKAIVEVNKLEYPFVSLSDLTSLDHIRTRLRNKLLRMPEVSRPVELAVLKLQAKARLKKTTKE